MREVEVHIWCDIHGRGTDAEVERVISIDGSKPLRLDLCPACDKELVGDLIDYLNRLGVTPDPESKTKPRKRTTAASTPDALPPEYRTCPECGRVSATRAALGQHLAQRHDSTIKTYVKQGLLPPVATGRPAGEESA